MRPTAALVRHEAAGALRRPGHPRRGRRPRRRGRRPVRGRPVRLAASARRTWTPPPGLPATRLDLDGAAGEPLVRRGRRRSSGWSSGRTAALCCTAIGICEEALRLTAEYTKTREQFDRPIATFQAVGQRAADAYIDTEAVRLTAWQAAWRLSEGLPATEQVAIAKFWCAEGGQRVVHAAQHLHGGMGVDRDYPLHRYFLWAKELELTLGGATASLLGLGALLAAEPG